MFCCGWSSLLPADVLSIPELGVIGFHPALLPANRGRHPIIWALALGLNETGSTFFRMVEEADAGPIINQRRVPIHVTDYAADLYTKIAAVGCEQLTEIVGHLNAAPLPLEPQNKLRASSWRKRTPRDGKIDFRMSARSIYNLVRALSRPYPGAYIETQDALGKVWRAREVYHHKPLRQDDEPGKVLGNGTRGILVQCGDRSVLWLTDHEFQTLPEVGSYL